MNNKLSVKNLVNFLFQGITFINAIIFSNYEMTCIILMQNLPQFRQNVEINYSFPVDWYHFSHGLLKYRLNDARKDVWISCYRSLAFYRLSIGIPKLGALTNEYLWSNFSYRY